MIYKVDGKSCLPYLQSQCKVCLTRKEILYTIDVKLVLHSEVVERMKNRLEEIRKSKGLNQEELADKLQVSRQTISSLENGRYNPSIILAFKIARFFNMNIEDIFIYEEDGNGR